MKLKGSTHFCKSCFKDAKFNNFHSLFFDTLNICSNCIFESNPIFEKFKISGYEALSIFRYDEYMKGKIYLYKKLEDIEINDLFITPYLFELRLIFDGFIIMPIPSYKEDDLNRGYNHVIEIFKKLNFNVIDCLVKTENIKQKELQFAERKNIGKYFKIKDVNLRNKKVLLVDDLVTTGSSMKAAIKLIEEKNPKELKILCVAHTSLGKNT